MDVVGDRVLVNLADAAFLRPNAAGKIAKVVDRQRDVGVERFADRLAVVHRFGVGQQFQVLLDAVCDFEQHVGALRCRRAAPGSGGGVGGV